MVVIATATCQAIAKMYFKWIFVHQPKNNKNCRETQTCSQSAYHNWATGSTSHFEPTAQLDLIVKMDLYSCKTDRMGNKEQSIELYCRLLNAVDNRIEKITLKNKPPMPKLTKESS